MARTAAEEKVVEDKKQKQLAETAERLEEAKKTKTQSSQFGRASILKTKGADVDSDASDE